MLENIAKLMEEMKEFIFQVHTNRSRLYPLGNTCEEWKKIYRDFETKGKFKKLANEVSKFALKIY